MLESNRLVAGRSGAMGALLVVIVSLSCGRRTDADERTIHRMIGDTTYRLRLVFEDDFENLDNWLVETTGKVVVKNNWLEWGCFSSGKQAGTIWCKREFAGPTVVQFDAVGEAGARNLNFLLYATHPKGLLQTTNARSGEYKEYHVFPNYIVTYLTPRLEGESDVFSTTRWRLRFRKNPGFELLSERFLDTDKKAERKQRITYVSDGDGWMKFFVDGKLLHEFEDKASPYRSGYHGFRTWNSDVEYANFKVFTIRSDLN
jgi:hypothetical protein